MTQSARIVTLDAVRGFAVLGILAMNITSMGMPGYAYIDPTYYGLRGPADLGAWFASYVLAEGKMRALFTMLFGASMVLIAERAQAAGEIPAETHYRRMFWLFVFGTIHAWLIWYGDILVSYAVAGALGFSLWRWKPRALWIVLAAMLALQLAINAGHYLNLATTRDAALAADATPAAVKAWADLLRAEVPAAADIAREVTLYRGGVAQVFEARIPSTIFFQTVLMPLWTAEILAFITLGILLFRNGFFTGDWSRAGYLRIIALGYLVAVPLTVGIARLLIARDFDPVMIPLTDSAGLLLRPFIALAHAAIVILLVRSDAVRWLTSRLAAAGRMALSNYLGTSLITTTLFYGYGFGLFGHLGRAQLYIVVAAIWVAILLWSKPWLDRFAYGPMEWLWRSLARGEAQRFSLAINSQ